MTFDPQYTMPAAMNDARIVAVDLYRNQEATSLDLAASENALADARRGAVTTRLQALFALLRVHFAAGDLKAALLPEPSPAPKEEKP